MEQNKPTEQLSKKEQREFKHQEKEIAKELAAQKRRFKKIASWGLGGGLIVAIIGGLVWYAAIRPPVPESDIVSRNAFHWHSELAIYVKGEKQEIPSNIGIGAVHQPIHTHNDSDQGNYSLGISRACSQAGCSARSVFQKLGEGYQGLWREYKNDSQWQRKYRV